MGDTITSVTIEDKKPAAKPNRKPTTDPTAVSIEVSPLKRKEQDEPTIILPKKRTNFLPTRELNNSNTPSTGPHISVYAFHPILPIEAYLYIRDQQNDVFVNGYKKFCDKNLDDDELTKANFTKCLNRRVPNTNNQIMLSEPKKFFRKVMIRYVADGTSTKETRQHGLRVIENFLKSDKNTDYVLDSIPTVDCTDESDPPSLDSFLLDKDIEEIIRNVFEESELNKDFYSKYKSVALKLWSGTYYSDFARQLGFPQ